MISSSFISAQSNALLSFFPYYILREWYFSTISKKQLITKHGEWYRKHWVCRTTEPSSRSVFTAANWRGDDHRQFVKCSPPFCVCFYFKFFLWLLCCRFVFLFCCCRAEMAKHSADPFSMYRNSCVKKASRFSLFLYSCIMQLFQRNENKNKIYRSWESWWEKKIIIKRRKIRHFCYVSIAVAFDTSWRWYWWAVD